MIANVVSLAETDNLETPCSHGGHRCNIPYPIVKGWENVGGRGPQERRSYDRLWRLALMATPRREKGNRATNQQRRHGLLVSEQLTKD